MSQSPLHTRVRSARREQKLSQSAVAQRVGCKQSALSMFEGGRANVLATEKVVAICELLGIEQDPEVSVTSDDVPSVVAALTRAFCPQAECPSNIPYVVAGELRFLPVHQWVEQSVRHCRFCGELLEQVCPECGQSVAAGACCVSCGCAYVVGVPETGGDLHGWVTSQRALVQLARG